MSSERLLVKSERCSRPASIILSIDLSMHATREFDDEEQAEKERERLNADIQKVESKLYDSHLQQRYDLKRTSKAPSFTGIDWDIKVKHFDAKLGDFEPFPYATCKISFQREFDDSPFVFFGGRAFDSAQINFTIDDIDHLSQVLAKVRERLHFLENAGG